ITGGTGFVGQRVAAQLRRAGHVAVVLGRADDPAAAFAGCDAIVHCAGVNREIGSQTYRAVHVAYTRSVVAAARRAGVRRIVMLSFLRARPDCGSGYHESKWAAEEIVRGSGLAWTILKAGVIYGRGDHMLDHLSRAFHSFPIFGLVGFRSRPVRPVAVDDVARILVAAAIGDERLARGTFAVLGPDELLLSAAVRRVADVAGRRPWFVPLPIAGQRLVASVAELLMTVPLLSRAQVRILAEGIVEPLPAADGLPVDLLPTTRFDEASIRAGLPPSGGFGRRDLRWCAGR
ncbi:MAG TPA: NAD(P)H-binding protein, partial [Candidatus Limnocylindrales bacterium]|nr:NAD(P)H-binding protein [Candidatus Limnocylindrales bacterium]